MRISTVTAAGILSLATTAFAVGNAIVDNDCVESVYLTITRSDQTSTQRTIAGTNGTYSEVLSGQGNSFGVTKSADYWSSTTPKLIFGYSEGNDGLSYWTVSTVDGDPTAGEGWKVAPSVSTCTSATNGTMAGQVYTCTNTADLVLTLCPK